MTRGVADNIAEWGMVDHDECTPIYGKNKLLFNEYFSIFMYFESIFFLNLENGLFQIHPPTKSGKFQIFFLLTIP